MMNKQLIIVGVTAGVAGIAIGGTAGFFIAKGKYAKRADEEIESVRETFKQQYKTEEYSTPAAAAETLGVKVGDLGYDSALGYNHVDVETTVSVPRGISFETPEERESRINYNDYSAEEQETGVEEVITNAFDIGVNVHLNTDLGSGVQDPEKPYIISLNEYMEDHRAQSKVTVTYFEGDDTLTDERDAQVPDVEGTVGSHNLALFGQGEDDTDMIYVRNEKLEVDFEIVRDKRSYAEFLGAFVDDERIKPAIRKMRSDD